MDKELSVKIKKEIKYLFAIFIVSIVLLKITFYSEGLLTILRTSISIFWAMAVPGFCLMYSWHEKLKFFERFVMGTVFGTAVLGIASYYFGLIGIHVKFHGILLPVIILIIAVIIIAKKKIALQPSLPSSSASSQENNLPKEAEQKTQLSQS